MDKNSLLKNILEAHKNGTVDSDLALETIDLILTAKKEAEEIKIDNSIIKNKIKSETKATKTEKDNKIKFKVTKIEKDAVHITSINKQNFSFYTKPTHITLKIKQVFFPEFIDKSKDIKINKTIHLSINIDEKNKKIIPISISCDDQKFKHKDYLDKNTYLKSLPKNNVGHFGEVLLLNKLRDATKDSNSIVVEHTADSNISSPCDITVSNNNVFYYIDVKSVVHEGLNLQIKSDQFLKRWETFKDKNFYYCLVKTNWKNEGSKTKSISQSFIHIRDVKKCGKVRTINRGGRDDPIISVDYYSNRNLFVEFDQFIKAL